MATGDRIWTCHFFNLFPWWHAVTTLTHLFHSSRQGLSPKQPLCLQAPIPGLPQMFPWGFWGQGGAQCCRSTLRLVPKKGIRRRCCFSFPPLSPLPPFLPLAKGPEPWAALSSCPNSESLLAAAEMTLV